MALGSLCASWQAEEPEAQVEAKQAGGRELGGDGVVRTDSPSSPGSTTVSPGQLWSLTESSRTGGLGVPFTAGTVGR